MAIDPDPQNFGFQSTLPIQGETRDGIQISGTQKDFNPLSLYRERLVYIYKRCGGIEISIHSPYTGRDLETED